MDKVVLGRTGLKVTIAGLGGGGHSRLGLPKYGEDHAAGVVRKAFDLGVNFFDTAAAYKTEGAMGLGLEGIPRDQFVLSSKFPYGFGGGGVAQPAELMSTLEAGLRALKLDYVDIYHIHGLLPKDYDMACEEYVPVMQKAKEQGKLRFLGVTERFAADTSHQMLQRAIADGIFDVAMVGYNMLNPSAAKTVLPAAAKQGVGILNMFAVRSALSDPIRLKANLDHIAERGQGGTGFSPSIDIFDFLVKEGAAETVLEAAYRFCRHSSGVNVTLTGTSNVAHLEENLRSIEGPPLPPATLAKLETIFGNVDCADSE
ncbi:MAG: aldo/keto reductase [Peptococcaceae bacterium]|jgi:aryl-alcohol dehydrogenase-like predicted oxidoreductase|nr:aldo/keto reductase [Peptococcaceae bacterium]